MNAWWISRTVRERMLISVAGFLLAVAVIWQFVLHPAIYTLERARLDHERAAQTVARIDRIATLIEQGHMISPALVAPTTTNLADIKIQAIQLASETGLSIEVDGSNEDSSLNFQVNNASGPDFFKWVEQVESRLGLNVSAASLQQNAQGGIDVNIQFSLDGAP